MQPTKREDFECLLGGSRHIFSNKVVSQDDGEPDTKPLSKIFITPLLKKVSRTPKANITSSSTAKTVSHTSTDPTTSVSQSVVTRQLNRKRYSSLKARITENEASREEEIAEGDDVSPQDGKKFNSKMRDTKAKETENENENGANDSDKDISNMPDYRRMCVVTNWYGMKY